MELFTCPKPELGNLRLTRVTCGKRHKMARKGDLTSEQRLGYEYCKPCGIGAAHARGETPDVTLEQVTAKGTPGGPPPRGKGDPVGMPAHRARPRASWRSPRTCPACGDKFNPTTRHQKCCSRKCAGALQRRAPAPVSPPVPTERSCAFEECGKTFQPRSHKQQYCDPSCSSAAYYRRSHPKAELPERECARDGCTVRFVPRTRRSRFHSRACATAQIRVEQRQAYRAAAAGKPKKKRGPKPKARPPRPPGQFLTQPLKLPLPVLQAGQLLHESGFKVQAMKTAGGVLLFVDEVVDVT